MQLKPSAGFIQKAGKALKKASPTILTCFSIVGVVATAVLTAKATPKAMVQIEADSRINHDGDPYAVTKSEMVKSCWKCYVPALAAGFATIACICGANILNKRQQASLISAYAFATRSLKEYQQSVKNVYGEEGHKKVLENLIVEQPVPPMIYGTLIGNRFDFGETNEEKCLFYDSFSKRYFEAKISDVLLAELHTNRNFALGYGEVQLSEFYKFLGLDTPDELKDLSWFASDYYLFIDFEHSKIELDDGPGHEPVECWVIDMPFPPTLDVIEEA